MSKQNLWLLIIAGVAVYWLRPQANFKEPSADAPRVSQPIVNVDSSTFFNEVNSSPVPVVAYFWASGGR